MDKKELETSQFVEFALAALVDREGGKMTIAQERLEAIAFEGVTLIIRATRRSDDKMDFEFETKRGGQS